MRDFTLECFEYLCAKMHQMSYEFITFGDYCLNPPTRKFAIIRHDVDKYPENALRFAILEHKMKINSSYYFRASRQGFCKRIISEIADLGHEIGYHYEELSLVSGRLPYAIELFKTNLSLLRKLYPVKTICMHGSPLSRYDNRLLWKEYDYKDLGIVGDAYLDTDFSRVFYLTDTGRRWDGGRSAVRDKVDTKHKQLYRSTFDIIRSLSGNTLPQQVMINAHPQRWNDHVVPWFKELLWQNCKNVVKKYLLVRE